MASPPITGNGTPKESQKTNLTMASKPLPEPTPATVQVNGTANGTTNGLTKTTSSQSLSRTESHSKSEVTSSSETSSILTRTQSTSQVTYSEEQQVTVLRETVRITRGRFISEFSHVDDHYIDSRTIEGFLDYLERQRFTHMPHRGSRWDKVLGWAEFFAIEIYSYAKSVEPFVPSSKDAAKLVLAASCVLLDLGPSNAQALETTFGMFWKLGLSLQFFLRHKDILSANSRIRREVGHAFNALLTLVREVSIYYHARIAAITSNEISIDFNNVFGTYVDDFYRRKHHVTDAMWEYKLGGDLSIGIRTIRKWLSPRDTTLQKILDDRLAAKGHRDSYSCEWFQRYLLDFSRSNEDVLAITGESGCGKTYLSGWIAERLQRQLGRKSHQVLSYTIESDIPSKTGSISVAKNLILQLLENNVGNVALFNELVKVRDLSIAAKDSAKLEHALWEALNVGLKGSVAESENLMIVVDGLDEAQHGPHGAKAIQEHLERLASSHRNVQTIILGREIGPSYKKATVQRFVIKPDHTHRDLEEKAKHILRHYPHFRDLDEFKREEVVGQLSDAAKGNFLWVVLTSLFVKQESNRDGFLKAVKAVTEKPKTLRETIQRVVQSVDISKSHTKLLLSWMLVAQRPLQTSELQCLLGVDHSKGAFTERASDIKVEIGPAYGSLVIIQNGVVRFQHSAIRAYLLELQHEGKALLGVGEAQSDLTRRLLVYSKHHLTKKYEPSFGRIDMVDVDELFNKYTLLEYAVRNWILHFRYSSLHKNNSFDFPAEFKTHFPSSTHLALLEYTCWESQVATVEAVTLHELALRVREHVFTEKHESVLQNLIICGNLHKSLSNINDAGTYFYRASHVSQAVLHKHSQITITCTTTFLSVTETITVTTRNEFATRKEEMLKFVIEACKHQYREDSEIVIRYYKSLAQLYVEIHEEHHAEIIWKELHEIIIRRHGRGSEEDTFINEQLNIVLRKGSKHEDIIEYEKGIFDTTLTLDEWDIRRVKIIIDLAISFEASGEFFRAEELYIVLWKRLIEHCHHKQHHHGVEIHISMIDVALEYVRFLQRRNRHEEAGSILICIWEEYEEYDFESETIFLRLKVIGEIMKTISLFTFAVSVFKKCLTWFKKHSKHEHVVSIEILIEETTQEIIKTTTTVSTSHKETVITETIIKELFEQTISRTTVTSETITISRSLISYYMKTEQWALAIEVTKRSLTSIWRMIVYGGSVLALPKDFASDAIDIAIYLAQCHHRLHHYHETEEIYVRIYRACRNSCQIHDERLTRSYTILIKFYEEHRHWHKVISIYQELLEEYRKHLGASHTLTIKTLYILASLCSDHGHGNSLEYYEEIVLVLNGKSRVCHKDARDAMIVLSRVYYEQGHWHKCRDVSAILWETWVHHHHEHKFSADFIEVLYMRYRYVLEHHIRVEYGVLRTITIEFRDVSKKVFGASVAITVKALIEFAEISMKSEKYIHEAISTYEEVLTITTTTTTTTTISTTTITVIKQQLTKAYIIVCSSETVSTTTIERAIKIIVERYEYLKKTLGYASIETLIVLRELLLLRLKIKTKESHEIIRKLVFEATIEIIRHEHHSRVLFEAAKTLAGIYIACELREYGFELLRELHIRIITGKASSGSKFDFKFDKHISKVAFVFLVTFEETLRGTLTISYSELIADLLVEASYYESYSICIKENKIEEILIHGARLRGFLVSRKRFDQSKTIEHQVYEIFHKKWGSSVKTSTEITFVFFIGLLEELGKISHEVQFDTKRKTEIADAACISLNLQVHKLLEQGEYTQALELATCGYNFIDHHKAYHRLTNIGHAFKLATYLAGRGLEHPSHKPSEEMLTLSKTIIRDVLHVCKENKINFVRMQPRELNDLVALLGIQKNYADLEWLLNDLWTSREVQRFSRKVQKNWSNTTIIAVGKRLVQTLFLAGQRSKAIRLCEDICYNLRRVGGALDPKTLDMYDLLSQLYNTVGHYREALALHEDILRLVVEGDDDDDRTVDTVEPDVARHHLEELKRAHQRYGGWEKSVAVYRDIVTRLLAMKAYEGHSEFKGATGIDKWNVKEDPGDKGKFRAPEHWEFLDAGNISDSGEIVEYNGHEEPAKGGFVGKKRRGLLRQVSDWGKGVISEVVHGHEGQGKAEGLSLKKVRSGAS